MKRFSIYILCTVLLTIGAGAIVERVGARFKSDAKAVEIIAKARQALGGEAALAEVRSIVIKGQTTQTINVDGQQRTEQGSTEIVMQLPDKLVKKVQIGNGPGPEGAMKTADVVIVQKGGDGDFTSTDGRKVIVTKVAGDPGNAEEITDDGKQFTIRMKEGSNVREIDTADGKRVVVKTVNGGEGVGGGEKQVRVRRHGGGYLENELLRTTLSLLASAPEGADVSYTFVGEGTVDGIAVNTVDASAGGSVIRMHFDRATYLPVAISFTGHKMPMVFTRTTKEGAGANGGDVMVFTKKVEGSEAGSEHFVRFADYRSVNGVQMPHRWTTTIGGQTSEILEVTSYELNPADIAARFPAEKMMIRVPKQTEPK
jgi:hypothetical protein